MRTLAFLLLLACAAPAFAGNTVYGCISSHTAFPPETWFESVSDAREFCDGRAAFTTPGSVTETLNVQNFGDLKIVTYTYSGAASGGTRNYSIEEHSCTDPNATYSNVEFACIGGATDISADDIATYVGYILGAFAVGYAMGYGFRVFYKAVDMV